MVYKASLFFAIAAFSSQEKASSFFSFEFNLYKIGMMTEDDKKSFKYLKKSADLEYSDAILEIAYRYEIGKGVLSNVNKSIEYLHKVEHIPEALYHLGRLAYNNNEPTAYEYLKKAYEMNKHIKAGYYLALCYEAGLGCLCDIHKSLKIYDELLTLVEILSDRAWIIHSKAYCYKKLGNIETAIKLFEDSASMGEELSYQALGNIFFDNDRKRALKYYLKIKEKSDEINQKIQVCKNIHQFPRFTQHNLSYLPADLGKLRMHQHFLAV